MLSILTATLPERAHFLKELSNQINPQIDGKPVEWLIDPRPRNITTGQKRNDLIRQASGAWVCHVDDDDVISKNYVSKILEALQQNPDVVTFEGDMYTDGRFTANWVIKLGENWEARGNIYYRFPNHLSVIRKSIAKQIPFPNITMQEDYQWAVKLRDSGLLKTSVHIQDKLYRYAYRSKK